jgi:hypothetical protein
MRLCLTVLLAPVVLGGTLRSDPPGATPRADRPTGFDPPVTLLGGSDYHAFAHVPGGYPAFADVDGDGTTDLVVGVTDRAESHDGGRLLVYRNRGTDDRPAYAKPTWLDATVPSARIPDG